MSLVSRLAGTGISKIDGPSINSAETICARLPSRASGSALNNLQFGTTRNSHDFGIELLAVGGHEFEKEGGSPREAKYPSC